MSRATPRKRHSHYNTYQSPSLASIRAALECISPDLPRSDWAKIGMALAHELGSEGFRLFDEWSSCGSAYSAADTRTTWRSVVRCSAVSISTLFWYARQNGYRGGEDEISFSEFQQRYERVSREKEKSTQQEEKRTQWAESLLFGAIRDSTWPITDTPAEKYLSNRLGGRVLPNLGEDLRYHASLEYRHSDGSREPMPALIGILRNRQGGVVSAHRTYLTEGGEKAPVETPKRLMPFSGLSVTGAGVYLGDPASLMVIAEGVENAVALSVLHGLPAIAATSAENLASFTPQKPVRQLLVGADNDATGTGQNAAHTLRDRLGVEGVSVKIYTPTESGTDWTDVLGGGV